MKMLSRRAFVGASLAAVETLRHPFLAAAAPQCVTGALPAFLPNRLTRRLRVAAELQDLPPEQHLSGPDGRSQHDLRAWQIRELLRRQSFSVPLAESQKGGRWGRARNGAAYCRPAPRHRRRPIRFRARRCRSTSISAASCFSRRTPRSSASWSTSRTARAMRASAGSAISRSSPTERASGLIGRATISTIRGSAVAGTFPTSTTARARPGVNSLRTDWRRLRWAPAERRRGYIALSLLNGALAANRRAMAALDSRPLSGVSAVR